MTSAQERALYALGPWAEGPVESTPETRAELIRNVADAVAQAVQEAYEDGAMIAWEYARGLRQAEPNVGSAHVGDHIAAALRARPAEPKPVTTMLGQPITAAERDRISKDGP